MNTETTSNAVPMDALRANLERLTLEWDILRAEIAIHQSRRELKREQSADRGCDTAEVASDRGIEKLRQYALGLEQRVHGLEGAMSQLDNIVVNLNRRIDYIEMRTNGVNPDVKPSSVNTTYGKIDERKG